MVISNSRPVKESVLGTVLLLDPNGSLDMPNVHPAHHSRLKGYEEQGIKYELRRDKKLTLIEPKGVLVYRVG